MGKAILIAGKSTGFASEALKSGRKVAMTKANGEETVSSSGIDLIQWNRPSALSARSLVMKAINDLGTIDECVIMFDEKQFIETYGNIDSTAENVRIIEELISSYQYLTIEVISRIQKKNRIEFTNSAEQDKKPVRLVYLYKTNPSMMETALSKNTLLTPSSPFLSTAAAAFKSYAENIAATLLENDSISPLLVQCDSDNELYTSDQSLASWLFSYIETLDSLKRPLSVKQKLTWTKAGTKTPGGFGFFS